MWLCIWLQGERAILCALLAGWCINVTHASTVGRKIYDTLGTCTFLSLHCCRLLIFCQSVCCYGNTPLPFSDQNPNLNPTTLHLPLSPHSYASSSCSLSFAHTNYPFLYRALCSVYNMAKFFRKGSTGRTHTQAHKLLIGTRHPQVQEILVLVSRRKQLVIWRKRDIWFLPFRESNLNESLKTCQKLWMLGDPAFVLTSPIALRLVN